MFEVCKTRGVPSNPRVFARPVPVQTGWVSCGYGCGLDLGHPRIHPCHSLSTVRLGPLDIRDRNSDDIRVVALRYQSRGDWESGARGDIDMWIFAENVVAERRLESTRK
jgi:hypothetical protein